MPPKGGSAAAAAAPQEYTIRVHIPGEMMPLCLPGVNISQTFNDLKAIVWKTRAWDEKVRARKAYMFRACGGEYYFSDDDLLNSLVYVAPCFRESPTGDKLSVDVTLYPVADVADKQKRDSLLCSASPILLSGYLNKLGEGLMAGWSRRFCVLQDNTLFYFSDEKSFNAKEKAKGYIPMPCTFVRHINYKGQGLVFELQAKHLGKRNYFMQAESEASLETWKRACVQLSVRRVKSVSTIICQDLINRGLSELELIFQMPGNKEIVSKLKSSFDNGETSDPKKLLSDISDYKAMADVIKLSLKETLQEPALSFALHPKWILVAQDEATRIPEIRSLLTQLPYQITCYLEYLFGFMNQLAASSGTNMMTPKILAICLGPILLRSEKEAEGVIASKAAENGDYRGIETMIDKWSACFAEEKVVSLFDTPSTTTTTSATSAATTTPPAAAASTAAAPPPLISKPSVAAVGEGKDGPVSAADAAAWLKKFQLANANWEKDWRLRQKNVMSGLADVQNQIKTTGAAIPTGLVDVNACFVGEAEWRTESISNCDELIAKINKLTKQVSAS